MLQVGVRQLNCRCAGTCDNGDDPEQDRGRLKERGQVLYINVSGMPPELQCKFSKGVRLLTNCTCKVRSRKNKRPAQLVLDLVYISITSGISAWDRAKETERERQPNSRYQVPSTTEVGSDFLRTTVLWFSE